MSKGLRTLVILGGVLVLLGSITAWMILPDRSLEEVAGLSKSAFDDEARGNLPPSASRIMRYTTGFVDSSTWTAYTADRVLIEKMVKNLSGHPLQEFEEWDAGRAGRFTRPARPNGRNRGYWDVEDVISGKTYSDFDGAAGVDILVDTKRWRIFIHQYTT